MYSVACTVGRLLEVRVFGLRTLADVDRYENDLRVTMTRHPGRFVGCCDLRVSENASELFAPDVAEALIALLGRNSPRVEKSALLLPIGHATFHLQVDAIRAFGPSRPRPRSAPAAPAPPC
jgi:hypothetical protein